MGASQPLHHLSTFLHSPLSDYEDGDEDGDDYDYDDDDDQPDKPEGGLWKKEGHQYE